MTQESGAQEIGPTIVEEKQGKNKKYSYTENQALQQYLHFKELEGVKVPSEYMLIDEALDEIGKKRLPGRWGLIPHFQELPFFSHNGVDKRLFLRKKKNGWERIAEEVYIKANPRVRYYNLKNAIFVVRHSFIEAVENSKFVLRFFNNTKGVLGPLRKGVPTAQQDLILNIGRGIPPRPKKGMKPLVVILEREPFQKWLNAARFLEEGKEEFDDGHRKIIPSAVSEGTVDFLRGKGVKFTKDWLLDLLREADGNGKSFSDYAFEKFVWKNGEGIVTATQKINGPPSKIQLDAMKNIREEALQVAAKAYRNLRNSNP